jgi:hypothetical protein
MRGQVAVDLSGFVTAALAAAEVIMDSSTEVVELDLNPVIVGMSEGAAVAVDAVVFLRSETADGPFRAEQ